MMNYVLEVEHLSVNYEKNSVLWDVNFAIPEGGHLVAIVGPNGAGKSTLLKSLLGIVKPTVGTIRFFGKSFDQMSRKIAYIPQRGEVDWEFPITAYEVVLMGAIGKSHFCGWPTQASRRRAYAMLEKVGMQAFAHRQIAELSGGQQQRLFIARALMQEADLYLLDEPFVGVDSTTEQEIFNLFRELKALGKTLVIIHHDLLTVETCFDWVVILNICLVAAGPTASTLTPSILAKAYGKNATLLDEALKRGQQQKTGIV